MLKPNPITRAQCKARVNVCMSLDATIMVSRVLLLSIIMN